MICIAKRDGRFSQRSTWSKGRVPRKGDTVRPNGHLIKLDSDIAVKRIDCSATITGSRPNGSVINVNRNSTIKCECICGGTKGAAVTNMRRSLTIIGSVFSGPQSQAEKWIHEAMRN